MFSYTILLYSLTGKNECELICRNTLSDINTLFKVNYQMSLMTSKTMRKDVFTSHQKVHISELVLNRKQNAFQTHLTQC